MSKLSNLIETPINYSRFTIYFGVIYVSQRL